jgi:hypothetical protein
VLLGVDSLQTMTAGIHMIVAVVTTDYQLCCCVLAMHSIHMQCSHTPSLTHPLSHFSPHTSSLTLP